MAAKIPLINNSLGKTEELQSTDSIRMRDFFRLKNSAFLYDDYMGYFLAIKGSNFLTGSVAFIASIDKDHGGVVQITTGASATGWCCFTTQANALRFSSVATEITVWESVIRTDVLSTATQEYVVYFGIGDNVGANTEPANGAYFKYVRTTSVNYQICTASAGTRTLTTTSTAVPASTFVRFKIIVEGNSLASFYINDVLVGTSATNIPTASSLACFIKIVKTVGTTARQWYEDSFFLDKDVVR